MNPTPLVSEIKDGWLKYETTKDKGNKQQQTVIKFSVRPCPVCGNYLMVPSGSCHVCQICGSTNGCS